MIKKYFLLLPLLLGVIAGMATMSGCVEEGGGPVRVGTNVWLGYEPAYLARDLGYYDETEIVLTRHYSATKVLQAFRDGSIDIAALTLDEAIALAGEGLDITVFFVTNVSDGADVIMTLEGSGIDSVSDLEGRRVGVEANALGAYVLVRALQIHGVSLENVKTLYVAAEDAQSSLRKGDVDAVITYEPYRTRMALEGAKDIFTSREIPGEIFDVLVTSSSFAEKNPAALKRLAHVWEKAIDFIMQQPEQAGKMMSKRLHLPVREIDVILDGITLPDRSQVRKYLADGGRSPLMERASGLIDLLVHSGVWTSKPPISGLVTDAYLDQGLKP